MAAILKLAAILDLGVIFVFEIVLNRFYTLETILVKTKMNNIGQLGALLSLSAFSTFGAF